MSELGSPLYLEPGWLTILPDLIAKGEAYTVTHPHWLAGIQQTEAYRQALAWETAHPLFRGDFRPTFPSGVGAAVGAQQSQFDQPPHAAVLQQSVLGGGAAPLLLLGLLAFALRRR